MFQLFTRPLLCGVVEMPNANHASAEIRTGSRSYAVQIKFTAQPRLNCSGTIRETHYAGAASLLLGLRWLIALGGYDFLAVLFFLE
jgi:hypothetical protein